MRTGRPPKGVGRCLLPTLDLSILCELFYSWCIIFLSLIIKDLEKQEELEIAHIHVKEHQKTIEKLRGIVSQKTDEISNMQIELENSNAALKAQVFCFKLLLSNRV